MWVAGLLEFILGNTFPFLVFMSFGKTRILRAFETRLTDIQVASTAATVLRSFPGLRHTSPSLTIPPAILWVA